MDHTGTGHWHFPWRSNKAAGAAGTLLLVSHLAGCGPQRITLVDKLQTVRRVAIVDVSQDVGLDAGEPFTNEFISLGYEVLERSNLDQIIR